MLLISESASQHLRDLLAERGLADSGGLRLSVEKGGCAGLQYAMEIGRPEPGDATVGTPGAQVFVAPDSAAYLDGCTLDYHDDLAGAGFRIVNPRAARSCGCGTSFEAAEEPALH